MIWTYNSIQFYLFKLNLRRKFYHLNPGFAFFLKMYWPLPLHPNTFGLNWQVATKENPFASIFRTINSVNAILSGRSNEDLTGNRVKCGFKRSCDWKCLLSEETVLSVCGLHHKIKPQYGGKKWWEWWRVTRTQLLRLNINMTDNISYTFARFFFYYHYWYL